MMDRTFLQATGIALLGLITASAYSPQLGCERYSISLLAAATGKSTGASWTDRRHWLARCGAAGSAAFGVLTTESTGASAATGATELATYDDPAHGFSIQVPASWDKTTQELPDRRKIILWKDPVDDGKTIVFIAYTPVRDDFTSLGSFGSVDQVAAQTILPKGKKTSGEDVRAEMLKAEAKKQAYFFDYRQEVPGVQPETHLRTIFALETGATGGAGAVLVTITAQTPEERYARELRPVFDAVVDSYGKSKA